MKKILVLVLCLFAIFALPACGNEDEKGKTVVVTFETGTDTLIAAQVIEVGGKVKEPSEVIDKPANRLLGWYCNGVKWDFDKNTVTENTVLTAKWEKYLTIIGAEDDSGEMWLASCSLNVENAIIPATYNGKTVTRLRNCAFAERKLLKSVVIPNTITNIEGKVFYGCDGLQSVVIPSSVTTMGSGAFEKCEGLKYIYCEADQMPEGWAQDFNLTGATVIFGYKG